MADRDGRRKETNSWWYLITIPPQQETFMSKLKDHFLPSLMTAVMVVILSHLVGWVL